MRGFDAKFIEELKNRNDIVDIIGRYVRLEQRGTNFWGRCPFHHEKTASFSVNPINQFFYCFGCHKSGDVISFIMAIESLDFTDAVKFLADRVGLKLPENSVNDKEIKEQKQKKERLLSLLKDTATFYVKNLSSPKAEGHIAYIESRKISFETVTKFGIGASLDYNGLVEHLKAKGYTKEEMVESGAVGEKNGRCYDFLGGRLIIPVIDGFNNVVAFCGRRIDGGKEQKYVNSHETYVFSKGKTLFNINNLKKLKNERGLDSIIIVEGHLDVVSLVQAGVRNVVASMGTALTKDQARILKRYAEKIYISYDGDFAGQKAAIRGLEILKEEGLDVKVVALPDGKDPDDVIKEVGKEGYDKLLLSAKPLIDFKIDILKNTFDLSTVDGKRKFIVQAIKVVKESESPSEQEDLLKNIRDLTGTTYESLKRELASVEDGKKTTEDVNAFSHSEKIGDKVVTAERFILYSYLFNKYYAKEMPIDALEFGLTEHKEIANYISIRKRENAVVRFSDLYDVFSEYDKELSLIAGMETDENKKYDEAMYFADCVKVLKINSIDKLINAYTKEFKECTDASARREIAQKLSALLKEKNQLN